MKTINCVPLPVWNEDDLISTAILLLRWLCRRLAPNGEEKKKQL